MKNNIDSISTDDKLYMRRALELASLGAGDTSPNPLVGAVLVHQGRIIGEGYHHRWGMPHAEVMALRSVSTADKSLIRESTLYVTLEPCSHYGKTPPCAELIIEHHIPRVVIAQLDPFPEVSGRGLMRLREQGISVSVSCLEDEARELNRAFNCRYALNRPFVALKWAESMDGFMDLKRSNSTEPAYVFSSPYRQRLVHRARRDYQAILVGKQTALLDNPSLTNRYWGDRQPIRLILDPHLSLPRDLRVFTDGQAPTWILYNSSETNIKTSTLIENIKYIGLTEISAPAILSALKEEGIISLYVEGGSRTLQMFIDSQLYDLIDLEKSHDLLHSGIPAPTLHS